MSIDYNLNGMQLIINSNLTYRSQKYRREFSCEDILKMYNDHYINFNLKNLYSSRNVEFSFIPIKYLNIDENINGSPWSIYDGDPFIKEYLDKKINLGLDIIKNGTYWPIVVTEKFNKLYVQEGNHRVISLKLCSYNGYIDENFEILCIRIPYDWENFKIYERIKNPFNIRFELENRYGSEYLNNEYIYNAICQDIINKGGRIIDNYTGQITVYNKIDIAFCIMAYSLFLRDLIYNYQDIIKPSAIINNKDLFANWTTSLQE